MNSLKNLTKLQQVQKNFSTSAQKVKDFNIVFIGGEQHPVSKLIKDDFDFYFQQRNLIPPTKRIIKNEQEYDIWKNQLNDVDMISLIEFGTPQVELLLKIYEQQKQNVKFVHGFLVGVDKFLPQVNHILDPSVIIQNAKGSFSESLGEYVVFSCYYHAKKVPLFNKMQAQHKWIREPINMIGGKTVAVFGFGNIGQVVGQYCKNAGMNVIAVVNRKNNVNEQQKAIASDIYNQEDIDEVLFQADYVVNTMPLTDKTNHYFDLDFFKKMKKSGVFINIGRGQSHVEADLAFALENGIIQGASLDVFEIEPLPENSKLWDIENLYISQHCADVTTDYWELTYKTFLQNIEEHLNGNQMKNIVDRHIGY